MLKILDTAPVYERNHKSTHVGTRCLRIAKFYLHVYAFIHECNKPYPSLPSQPKLVLVYHLWRDGMLSWPTQHNGPGPLYMTNIAVVSCSDRHASVGTWAYAAIPQLLQERGDQASNSWPFWSRATMLTTAPQSRSHPLSRPHRCRVSS